MADVTIYKPAAVNVVVVDGNPPADQSAQITALTTERDALKVKLDAVRVAAQADKDADAASVAGQSILDIVGP